MQNFEEDILSWKYQYRSAKVNTCLSSFNISSHPRLKKIDGHKHFIHIDTDSLIVGKLVP